MRKFIFALLVSLIVLIQNNQAQRVVKIANVEVAPGTPTATVDFTVDGFTNLVGAQFSINYDSWVLSVNSVSNLNTTLNLSPVPGNNFNFPGTGTTKRDSLLFPGVMEILQQKPFLTEPECFQLSLMFWEELVPDLMCP
ncbi:MAG: hypothetical protein IPK25_01260 [Saprospiraceae bacterium]|nr:hypothetical protein [Saprospiraceae bacterium]